MPNRYLHNELFFETIDSPERAYTLGLFYADGNNFAGTRYRVSITLKKEDAYLLERVNNLLNSNRPIRYIRNESILTLSGKGISDQLSKLGCIPRKSLVLKFPHEEKIPAVFLPHFIRGYFDGDGCVHKKKGRNDLYLNFLGTLDFLSNLSNYLEKHNIFCRMTKGSSKIYRLDIYRKQSVENFRRLIYNNSTICLDRKQNKFNNIKENSYA